MRTLASLLLISCLIACNSQATSDSKAANDSTLKSSGVSDNAGKAGNDCANGLLFKKGVEISSRSYDGQGKETGSQVSTIDKVYTEGGNLVSEVKIINKSSDGEKPMSIIYTCDGEYLKMDLSFMMPKNGQKGEVSSAGILFPSHVTEGQTLPDANFSMEMKMGERSMKITTQIKERKVEAKEKITIPAGTFECFRIVSTVEAVTEMPGMDEQSKKIMEEAMKRAGKNKMIFWYSPELTILKMEYYMGERMVSRSEITNIKK